MNNIYDDSGNNNEPDYQDNLAFPPQMPLCDILELQDEIKKLKKLLLKCETTATALAFVMDWLKVALTPKQQEPCALLADGARDLAKKIQEALND